MSEGTSLWQLRRNVRRAAEIGRLRGNVVFKFVSSGPFFFLFFFFFFFLFFFFFFFFLFSRGTLLNKIDVRSVD